MQFRWRAGRRFRIARRTEVPDDRSHLRGRGYASTRFDPRNHGGVAFTDGAAAGLSEPQVAEWSDQKRMTLHAAISYAPRDGAARLGTIIVEADTRVSVEQRLVDSSSFRITRSNFPGASREEAGAAVAAV